MLHKMRGTKTHSCRRRDTDKKTLAMLGDGKGKDVDLGLSQDGSGTNKRGEAKWDCGPW